MTRERLSLEYSTMASTTKPLVSEPKPFQISVSEELLSFINNRVATARIPPGLDLPEEDAWAYGVPAKTMEQLKSYWETKYDWRAVEKRINSHLNMFTMPIIQGDEELDMHFVWHKSEREGALPLLIQHGWPGNFLEVCVFFALCMVGWAGSQSLCFSRLTRSLMILYHLNRQASKHITL